MTFSTSVPWHQSLRPSAHLFPLSGFSFLCSSVVSFHVMSGCFPVKTSLPFFIIISRRQTCLSWRPFLMFLLVSSLLSAICPLWPLVALKSWNHPHGHMSWETISIWEHLCMFENICTNNYWCPTDHHFSCHCLLTATRNTVSPHFPTSKHHWRNL